MSHTYFDACTHDKRQTIIHHLQYLIVLIIRRTFDYYYSHSNMNEVLNSDPQTDELVCPITYELFRDPVIAKDGQVYEREAITIWIIQNGTSPFTREPLRIEELQPHDHLKRLAAQRRNSTVSYNTRHSNVTLPSLSQVSPIDTQIPTERFNAVVENRCPIKLRCKSKIFHLICISFMIVLMISTIITMTIVLSSSSSTYRLCF